MPNIKEAFASSAALTITLNSLANEGARESTAVDNSANLYLDALVTVIVKLVSGTPGNEKAVHVYVYGSEDGTNFTDNATGTDAAVTLRSPTNLKLIGTINTPDSGALTYKSHPMSVARAFDGVLPREWGIVVQNKAGQAFDTTGNSASYSGVFATSS